MDGSLGWSLLEIPIKATVDAGVPKIVYFVGHGVAYTSVLGQPWSKQRLMLESHEIVGSGVAFDGVFNIHLIWQICSLTSGVTLALVFASHKS